MNLQLLHFCMPTKPAQGGWQEVLPLWVAAKSPRTINYNILCVTGWLMQGNTFLGCHVWAGSPGVVFLKWSLSNGFKLLCPRACDEAESSQLLKHTQVVFPVVLIQSTHPLLNDSDLFNSQTFLDSNFVHSLLLGKLQVFQTLPLGFFFFCSQILLKLYEKQPTLPIWQPKCWMNISSFHQFN